MPHYPGGERALLQALMSELKYPETPLKEGIGGHTVVSFTVTKNGTIDDIKIRKSSGNEELDTEAVRAIKAGITEKWSPGTVGGEPVDCLYTLPVKFSLKKDDKKAE